MVPPAPIEEYEEEESNDLASRFTDLTQQPKKEFLSQVEPIEEDANEHQTDSIDEKTGIPDSNISSNLKGVRSQPIQRDASHYEVL